MKKLRLWNRRLYYRGNFYHVCVAAYSREDARRVVIECGYHDPGISEIKNYWSECWDRSMDGIAPERGMWIKDEHTQTVKRCEFKDTDRNA